MFRHLEVGHLAIQFADKEFVQASITPASS